ncbi:MAG TPA: hypothetical protein VG826_17050 [Pirellulales bacterium]|nr:hypothetical protein [Pirellulales bacterium]
MSNPSKTKFSLAVFLLAAVACLGPVALAPAADPQPKQAPSILSSESWQKTMTGLDEWFSVQPIYDRKEVDALKQDLSGRVEKMSPDDLEAFQQDLDAKLEMVLGPEGRDILGWVAASWAAASPAYRKKMDVQYPDIMKLTAAQLREQLDLLERRRSSARTQTERLEQSRQSRIAALQADQRQQFQERERALDRGASGGGYRTPYHPGGVRQYPDVVSRPAYGWGWGFGFW